MESSFETTAFYESQIGSLKTELEKERAIRKDAAENFELAILKAGSHTETVSQRYASEISALNEAYSALVDQECATEKSQAISDRIDHLTNALVDRSEMVTSLEIALNRTSASLYQTRKDEAVLVKRVENVEEQNILLEKRTKKVSDVQKISIVASRNLSLALQKIDDQEDCLRQSEKDSLDVAEKLELLKEDYKTTNAKLCDLVEAYSVVEIERDSLQERLQSTDAKLCDVEETVTMFEKERKTIAEVLQSAEEELSGSAIKLGLVTEERKSFAKRVEEADHRVGELQQKLAIVIEELTVLQETSKTNQSQLAVAESSLQLITDVRGKQEKKLKSTELKHAEASKKIMIATAEQERKDGILKATEMKLLSANEKANFTASELVKQAEILKISTSELSKANEKAAVITKERDLLRGKMEKAEASATHHREVVAKALKEEIASLKEQLTSCRKKRDSLQRERDLLIDREKLLQSHACEVGEKVSALQKENSVFEKRAEDLEDAARRNAKDSEEKMAEIFAVLGQERRSKEHIERELETLEGRFEKVLSGSSDVIFRDFMVATPQHEESSEKLSNLQGQLENLKRDLTDARVALDAAKIRCVHLEFENREMEKAKEVELFKITNCERQGKSSPCVFKEPRCQAHTTFSCTRKVEVVLRRLERLEAENFSLQELNRVQKHATVRKSKDFRVAKARNWNSKWSSSTLQTDTGKIAPLSSPNSHQNHAMDRANRSSDAKFIETLKNSRMDIKPEKHQVPTLTVEVSRLKSDRLQNELEETSSRLLTFKKELWLANRHTFLERTAAKDAEQKTLNIQDMLKAVTETEAKLRSDIGSIDRTLRMMSLAHLDMDMQNEDVETVFVLQLLSSELERMKNESCEQGLSNKTSSAFNREQHTGFERHHQSSMPQSLGGKSFANESDLSSPVTSKNQQSTGQQSFF